MLLISICCVACIRADDLRLVGTNLFDFSDAGANSRFHVLGTVAKIYPQSVELHSFYSYYERYVFSVPGASSLAMSLLGPKNVLAMKAGDMDATSRGVAVADMINSLPYQKPSAPLITPEQYNFLDSNTKNDYRQLAVCVTNYLLNSSNLKVGMVINGFAIPTRNNGFYDCGFPFSGDTNKFRIIYKIKQNRVVTTTNNSFVPLTLSTNSNM